MQANELPERIYVKGWADGPVGYCAYSKEWFRERARDEDVLYMREDIHQRDRKRLRRVLNVAKKDRNWLRLKQTAVAFWNDAWYKTWDAWNDAHRWSAAWKAAAKKWLGKAKQEHILVSQWVEAHDVAAAQRDELQRQLHNSEIGLNECRRWRNVYAEKMGKAEGDRDALAERLEAAQSVIKLWVWGACQGWCPVCKEPPLRGHLADCEIDAALRGRGSDGIREGNC